MSADGARQVTVIRQEEASQAVNGEDAILGMLPSTCQGSAHWRPLLSFANSQARVERSQVNVLGAEVDGYEDARTQARPPALPSFSPPSKRRLAV